MKIALSTTLRAATAAFVAALFALGLLAPLYATAEQLDPVAAVIKQLEEIDTLQEMQDARSKYAVGSRYNVGNQGTAVAQAHEAARIQYETYIETMFAARLAAQQAYDALSDSQKSLIDPALVEKLDNTLDTVFTSGTYAVTPRNGAYTFEAVSNGRPAGSGGGMCYEVSNHVTLGPEIPALFILVDTSNGETTWTPSGPYAFGQSNYEVTYCCDVETILNYGSDYKRINLEDSDYYGTNASQHIRAILQNAYPYITLEEMKANLVSDGLDPEFVAQLTRSDVIAATQMAIWAYANASSEDIAKNVRYSTSYDVISNATIYMLPLHDYTNELWTWWTTTPYKTSYDARAEYRVNTLVYYLCSLEGVAVASEDQVVISNIEVTRADLLASTDDLYSVGMYIRLNNAGSEQDDLKVTVTSYHTNDDGSTSITGWNCQDVGDRSVVEMYVTAQSGDTIEVVVDGTQVLGRGVYFYEPEGGRDASQCLVGVGSGETNVYAAEQFMFVQDITSTGLRIYKTAAGTGSPLSDITFDVYHVVPAEGETLGATPTEAEVARYAVAENLVGTITTDATGYAGIALAQSTYLVVERHNANKVVAPVSPFYVNVPLAETVTSEDGTVVTVLHDIVSIYPKNEPVTPPEEPPVVPPVPDNVTGMFEIAKHDASNPGTMLQGARFEVYRAATLQDTQTVTLLCDGVSYAAVPVLVGDSILTLTTDEFGEATSPGLTCGTYFLLEVQAPAGYNRLAEAVMVTVSPNVVSQTARVEIANQKGVVMPETGGMGTRAFWALGSVLAVGASILLVTQRRMRADA